VSLEAGRLPQLGRSRDPEIKSEKTKTNESLEQSPREKKREKRKETVSLETAGKRCRNVKKEGGTFEKREFVLH